MRINQLILDYDDMIQHGMIKTAESNYIPCRKSKKFAVVIKTAKSLVNKFPIETKTDVEHSIYAINNNREIPNIIKASAQYYTKLAADFYNIPVDWQVIKAPHIVNVKDIQIIKKANEDINIIKIAGSEFKLDYGDEIKEAEEFYLANINTIRPIDRINMGKLIIKSALYTPHVPNKTTIAYANAKYGNQVEDELELRLNARSGNEKYCKALSKLASIYQGMDAIKFLEIIQYLDKAADFDPLYHHTDYSNFLKNEYKGHDIDIDKLQKLANVGGDKELEKIT